MIGETFEVLDKGHVRLVDVMGDDAAIVQAARVSYGKGTKTVHEDRGLIRFLMRHRHTTPFEMCELKFHVRVPMDCWRQWIRHRTACLSGDTTLHFDLPGGIERRGNQLYKLTVKEVFDRFQPTENAQRPDKQGNSYHKRDRVQDMHLRCVSVSTSAVGHTRVVDIWESGEKSVYFVETASGASAKMSVDHLCWTDKGWMKLRDFVGLPENGYPQVHKARIHVVGPGRAIGVVPQFNLIDEAMECWRPVVGWEEFYEISDQGRVRRIVGGKGSRSFGRCKKVTVSNGRAVVSMNKPGHQKIELVHRLVLMAFVGKAVADYECCHNDGNALNNRLENLRWDTPKSNAEDRVRDGATTGLRCFADEVVSVKLVGKEMTYDIEVEGPWHNFSAGGLVVHNSVNEYSTRYSEAIDDKQQTSDGGWRRQSKSNKQGSDDHLDPMIGKGLTDQEKNFQEYATKTYKHRLEVGVAREQARKDLPLSTYTEAYWKTDLHNLFHFLSLRMDAHAQKEIRDYANIIGNEIVAKLFPLAWEAFVDYRLGAMFLSRLDVEAFRLIAASLRQGAEYEGDFEEIFTNKRERTEFLSKIRKIIGDSSA